MVAHVSTMGLELAIARSSSHSIVVHRSLCRRPLPLQAFGGDYRRTRCRFRRCLNCVETCSRCQRNMKPIDFARATSWCRQCDRSSMMQCSPCELSMPPGAFSKHYRNEKRMLSMALEAFSKHYRNEKRMFRRCLACSQTCSRCQRVMGSATYFAIATSWCRQCNTMLACAVCTQQKHKGQYNVNVRNRHFKYHSALVCLACSQLGYSSQDPTNYPCVGGHDRGHLAFSTEHLQH